MESSGADHGPKGMILNRESEEYYRGNGEWSHHARDAMQFDSLENALVEARQFNLARGCEFVVELNGKIGFRVLLPI
jgi:hypothetical protein